MNYTESLALALRILAADIADEAERAEHPSVREAIIQAHGNVLLAATQLESASEYAARLLKNKAE
jgi:hypothetical protein